MTEAMGEGWQPIDTAPMNAPVRVKAGGYVFKAILVPDGSMTSEEQSCDQWQACDEDACPPCWSDGCCWEVNEAEQASAQPTHWSPA